MCIREEKDIIRRIESVKETMAAERMKDTELNKEYDVYLIDINDEKYIIKENYNGYESNIYENLLSDKLIEVPKYYGKFIDSNSKEYIVIEYINGNTLNSECLDSYLELAKELAKIHKMFFKNNYVNSNPTFLKNMNLRNLELIKEAQSSKELEKYNMTDDILSKVESIANYMMSRPQALIHRDLLPINIMKSNNGVKIIDWESASIGCYAQDIGRLLYDFRNNNGEYWVKKEYGANILDTYYIEVSNNDFYTINRDEFEIDVQCSKIMNYAGIVLAHIVNGWDSTEWYKLNLENMIKGVKDI